MPVTISVGDAPAEMRAAVLAMKQADKVIAKDVNTRMRETMTPEWKSEVNQHLTGSGVMEGRMLTAGVRIAGGNPPQLIGANSKKKLGRGDLTSAEDWQMYEFGSHGTKVSKVTNRKGKSFTRRTTRGLPSFKKTGRVLYPSAAAILPRVASYFVQSVVKAFMDAAEGKH